MSNTDAFEALIDAVAEQTGKPRGVCRSLITELGAEIAKTVAEGEPVHIEGLGRFIAEEKSGEGGISFQAAPDLEELVNAPYAHMKPEFIEEELPADTAAAGEKSTTTAEAKEGEAEQEPEKSLPNKASDSAPPLFLQKQVPERGKVAGQLLDYCGSFYHPAAGNRCLVHDWADAR